MAKKKTTTPSATASFSMAHHTKGRQFAADAAGVLHVLMNQHGFLTPLAVVEAATPLDSPLHSWFEWDDTKAAQTYRLGQARMLIRELRVEYFGNDGTKTQPARVYLNLDNIDDLANAYVPMARILTDADLYERARQQFIREAATFEARYREFEALANLIRGAREQAEQLSA